MRSTRGLSLPQAASTSGISPVTALSTFGADGVLIQSTEDEFRNYVHGIWFPRAPRAALSPIFELYPDHPSQGSPFGTGDANQLAPMFKRMSAFQGDTILQAPRRFFLNHRSSKQPTWSYSECSTLCTLDLKRFIPGVVNERGCLAGMCCVSVSLRSRLCQSTHRFVSGPRYRLHSSAV